MRGSGWTTAQLAEIKSMVAKGLTAREIEPTTGRSRKAIIEAVRRYNLGPWLAKPGTKRGDTNHIPDDFAERWLTESQAALAEHYRRSPATICLWRQRLGLHRAQGTHITKRTPTPKPAKSTPMRLIKPNAFATAPVDRVQRDMSNVGQAVDFLRKYGAVYRCTERGAADVAGRMWRRGSAILTDAEVIERAERLGWDADAWKRVA